MMLTKQLGAALLRRQSQALVQPALRSAPLSRVGGALSSRSYSTSKFRSNEEKKEQTDQTASQEESEKMAEPGQQPPSSEAKIAELEERNKELQDRVLRALAEMENVRRIAARDVQTAREFSIQSFAKSLLDVADNLERAVNSVSEPEDPNSPLGALLQGVKMTDDQLQKAFRQFGVTKVGAVGEKFDPQYHDAMFEYEDPNKEPGTIGQIMKVGYLLNQRLIRPAQVGTVKAPIAENKEQ